MSDRYRGLSSVISMIQEVLLPNLTVRRPFQGVFQFWSVLHQVRRTCRSATHLVHAD